MGIFSRKNSRPSAHTETLSIETDGSRLSNVSTAKSPLFARDSHSSWLSPISSTSPSEPALSNPRVIDPAADPAAYLRTLPAVRERSRLVFQKARTNELAHFDVDLEKLSETAKYVVSIIKRDHGPDYSAIPLLGRWQHFDVGGRPRIDQLLASWPSTVDPQERTRRLIDLFLVSVLLDAGAGARWQYKSKQSGKIYRRSEGLAVASLEMFTAGLFSGDAAQPYQVDATGLKRLSVERLAKGLQTSPINPIIGLEGRTGLLLRLAHALEDQALFGGAGRPGYMLDYLLNHPDTQMNSVPIIPVSTLWSVLMDGLDTIWPASRFHLDGVTLGDAWPCSTMPASPPARPWESVVPFHKLTQWLTYSLMVPMSKILRIRFVGIGHLTGLPEYRNGGLFIDTGLLTLKPADLRRGLEAFDVNAKIVGQPTVEVVPLFRADDDVVVEWRAVTIGFLDELLVEVNRLLNLSQGQALTLAQMLEAGTWKGGRELAEVSRPNTKEPPIMILSDGTMF